MKTLLEKLEARGLNTNKASLFEGSLAASKLNANVSECEHEAAIKLLLTNPEVASSLLGTLCWQGLEAAKNEAAEFAARDKEAQTWSNLVKTEPECARLEEKIWRAAAGYAAILDYHEEWEGKYLGHEPGGVTLSRLFARKNKLLKEYACA